MDSPQHSSPHSVAIDFMFAGSESSLGAVPSKINNPRMKACTNDWTTWEIPKPQGSTSMKARAIISRAISHMIDELKGVQLLVDESDDQLDETSNSQKTDSELARLRSIMWATREEFATRASFSLSSRNALVPFNTLPVELAGAILALSLPLIDHPSFGFSENRNGLKRLHELALSVCTGYWHVVRSCPALWTSIKLNRAAWKVSLKLEKSGALPLTIHGWEEKMTFQEVFSLAIPHFHRCRSVDLQFDSYGKLLRACELLLKEPRPCLESVAMGWDSAGGEEFGPLDREGLDVFTEVAESNSLRHLKVKGVMLRAMGSLPNLQHLMVNSAVGVLPSDIRAIIESAQALEALSFSNVQAAKGIDHNTNTQLLLAGLNLTRMRLVETSNYLRSIILTALRAERVTTFAVYDFMPYHKDDPESRMLSLAIDPHGQLPILLAAIVNSGVDEMTMNIHGDSELQFRRPHLKHPFVFHSTRRSGWTRALHSIPHFAEFASKLPPTILTVADTDEEVGGPCSFHFLRLFPSIISLSIKVYCWEGPTLDLFENVLAAPHLIDGEWVWACPKLKKIELDCMDEPEDWDGFVRRTKRALIRRKIAGGDTIPPIEFL